MRAFEEQGRHGASRGCVGALRGMRVRGFGAGEDAGCVDDDGLGGPIRPKTRRTVRCPVLAVLQAGCSLSSAQIAKGRRRTMPYNVILCVHAAKNAGRSKFLTERYGYGPS